MKLQVVPTCPQKHNTTKCFNENLNIKNNNFQTNNQVLNKILCEQLNVP